MKACPDCAEEIKDEANVCRYCGYRFDGGDGAPARTFGQGLKNLAQGVAKWHQETGEAIAAREEALADIPDEAASELADAFQKAKYRAVSKGDLDYFARGRILNMTSELGSGRLLWVQTLEGRDSYLIATTGGIATSGQLFGKRSFGLPRYARWADIEWVRVGRGIHRNQLLLKVVSVERPYAVDIGHRHAVHLASRLNEAGAEARRAHSR